MAHILLLLSALTLSGRIPSAIDGGCRVVWIDADRGDAAPCQIDGRVWRCDSIPDEARGIVVAIGTDRVAIAAASGVRNVDPAPGLWGRLVRVEAADATSEPQDLTLRTWKPERSAVRSQLRRFRPVADESVRVLKLSAWTFWIVALDALDPDAYLTLDSADVGVMRMSTARLRDAAAETPFLVTPPMPVSLAGRVQNTRGEDVPSAAIELFQPLQVDLSPPVVMRADMPLIMQASTTSAADGSFTFPRVGEPPFLIVASSPAGRGSTAIATAGPPVIVQLVPPLHARGRVLRNKVPVAGARLHFVPTAAAWASSEDPAAHLAGEVASAEDGSFAIALPEQPAGELQIVAADGATARVPLLDAPVSRGAEIALGDVSIPDPRRIFVRLLEALQTPSCDIIAAGPMGGLGLQVVRASSAVNTYTIDLPESGQWVLSAECGGEPRDLVPMIATIPAAGPDGIVPTIDVRFAR